MIAYLFEVPIFESPDESDLGEVHDFRVPFRAVVEILERRPALRSAAEQIDSEADVGRCEWRGGSGGCGSKERAAVHLPNISKRWLAKLSCRLLSPRRIE